MAFRTWLSRLATRLSNFSILRRRAVIVLWRLHHVSDGGETACSFTEPSPDIYHVLLTYNGSPEIRRLVHGIDALVSWSENVKVCLHADGWREIDAPERSQRIPGRLGHERHTMTIGTSHVRGAHHQPKRKCK